MEPVSGRPTLRRAFVLVDARHGIKAPDSEIMSLLDRSAVSFQVVLTKADKLKRGPAQATLLQVTNALPKSASVQTFSATKGEGKPELISRLNEWYQFADTPAPEKGLPA